MSLWFMKTDRSLIGVEVRDWTSEFSPTVRQRPGEPGAERCLKWYTINYAFSNEVALLRVLRFVGMQFKHLTYYQRISRSEAHTRSWFPGYIFVAFDIDRDNWQQLIRMPGVIELLGAPTALPAGLVEDLELRFPSRLTKPSSISCAAVGTRVRVRSGSFEGHEATVTWSDRKSLKVTLMVFNRPTEVTLRAAEAEIV